MTKYLKTLLATIVAALTMMTALATASHAQDGARVLYPDAIVVGGLHGDHLPLATICSGTVGVVQHLSGHKVVRHSNGALTVNGVPYSRHCKPTAAYLEARKAAAQKARSDDNERDRRRAEVVESGERGGAPARESAGRVAVGEKGGGGPQTDSGPVEVGEADLTQY